MVITLIGNIASGKSSLHDPLAARLGAIPIYADDLFQTSNPFAGDYLDDLQRWAFTNELWMTSARTKLLGKEVKKSKQKYLIDSGLAMSWAYTYSHFLVGHIDEREWKLYDELFHTLQPKPIAKGTIVRLRYSLPTLMSRLAKRGRDFELESYTPQYLSQIEQGISAYCDRHADQVIVIDEQEFPEFVEDHLTRNAILERVYNHVIARE